MDKKRTNNGDPCGTTTPPPLPRPTEPPNVKDSYHKAKAKASAKRAANLDRNDVLPSFN